MMPNFSSEEKFLQFHLRTHYVERLSRYFEPINKTLQLQQAISVLSIQGYIARNILKP